MMNFVENRKGTLMLHLTDPLPKLAAHLAQPIKKKGLPLRKPPAALGYEGSYKKRLTTKSMAHIAMARSWAFSVLLFRDLVPAGAVCGVSVLSESR